MKISYRHEPDNKFWIGATYGEYTQEFVLSPDMEVNDVINCLRLCIDKVDEKYLFTRS